MKIHRGWFDQTFPKVTVDLVALAHIDCDFYEPTRLCLEKWYPMLSTGKTRHLAGAVGQVYGKDGTG